MLQVRQKNKGYTGHGGLVFYRSESCRRIYCLVFKNAVAAELFKPKSERILRCRKKYDHINKFQFGGSKCKFL